MEDMVNRVEHRGGGAVAPYLIEPFDYAKQLEGLYWPPGTGSVDLMERLVLRAPEWWRHLKDAA
jgi:hypothetical protein